MRKADVLKAMAKQLAAQRKLGQLARILAEMHPADAAMAVEELSHETAAELFHLLRPELAGEILAELSSDFRRQVLEHLEPGEIADYVEQMQSDEAADVIQDLQPDEAEEVLADLEPESRAELEELTAYEAESAGGMMAKEFAAVPADITAAEAIELLRTNFSDVEDLNVVFAVDDQNRLIGSCSLRDLVLAAPETPVRELVERHEHWVRENQDREEVARYMYRHNLDAVPVVDEQHRIVGQITLDDAAEALDEEAAEDMHLMAGLSEEERVFGPLGQSLRRRLPWLLFNILTALVAAAVLNFFQVTIAQAAVLAIFMPLVAGQGGNAGSQTLAVVIRGLAVGEVDTRDVLRTVRRMFVIGIIVGICVGSLVGTIAYLWKGSAALGGVVASAMVLNLTNGCVAGAIVPLALKRLGFDPAMGAGILVTCITDASGYLFLFGIGTWAIKTGLLQL